MFVWLDYCCAGEDVAVVSLGVVWVLVGLDKRFML